MAYWQISIICVISVTLCAAVTAQSVFPVGVPPVVANRGECPSNNARQMLQGITRDILNTPFPVQQNCGPGNWRRVFHLNRTNPDESCPSDWNAITSPIRACGGAHASCVSTFSDDVTTAYNRVCGRLFGDAVNSPDAFFRFISGQGTIEGNYLDGVSITHGVSGSRTHIWTLGAGHPGRCPCDSNDRNAAPLPPAEVGENYFCTRGGGNTLWEGEGCTDDNPCCSFHNPPYFSVQLPETTSDRIEIRICNDQSLGDESVFVHFAEIYVQ